MTPESKETHFQSPSHEALLRYWPRQDLQSRESRCLGPSDSLPPIDRTEMQSCVPSDDARRNSKTVQPGLEHLRPCRCRCRCRCRHVCLFLRIDRCLPHWVLLALYSFAPKARHPCLPAGDFGDSSGGSATPRLPATLHRDAEQPCIRSVAGRPFRQTSQALSAVTSSHLT